MSNAHLIKWIACLTLATGLTGCTSYKQHFENSPSDYGSRTSMHEATGFRTYNTQRRAADHNNNTMAYSQSSSDAVDDMKGIRTSFVIVTDKNAYVAILLDSTATGMKGKGTKYRGDRRIASPGVDHHSDVTESLKPGDIAMNKYSFPTIPDPQDISSELQTELTQKIRGLHPGITNVFISANQDFINRFSQYAHEAWRGVSLQPYVSDLNALVKDHFGDHGIIQLTP